MKNTPDVAISGIASEQRLILFVDTMLSTTSSCSSHKGKVIHPKISYSGREIGLTATHRVFSTKRDVGEAMKV